MWVLCAEKETFAKLTSMTAPTHSICLEDNAPRSDDDDPNSKYSDQVKERLRKDIFDAMDRILEEREHKSTVL